MTISERAKVTLSFIEPDDKILVWESLEWSESYLDPIGRLRVRLLPLRSQVREYISKTSKGAFVKLFFGSFQQCAYLITTRQITSGKEGVSIDIEAKSVLVTPYEGSVNPTIGKKYGTSVKISQVVNDALRDYGFENVFAGLEFNDENVDLNIKTGGKLTAAVRGDQPVIVDALKHKDIQPQPSETAYGFCSRIFSRYGLVLRVTALGELVLSYPRYKNLSLYKIYHGATGSQGQTVDRALGKIRISETNDGLFSEVVVSGRKTKNKKTKRANQPVLRLKVDYEGDKQKAVSGRPDAAFQNVRTDFLPYDYFFYTSENGSRYKPKFIVDKGSQDVERCRNMAFMAMFLNTSKGFKFECSVDGIRSRSGAFWAVNSMCDVETDLFQVKRGIDPESGERLVDGSFSARMLIIEKTVTVNTDGQRTDLTLIPEFSLRLGPRPGEK